jgi:hypothetical protein
MSLPKKPPVELKGIIISPPSLNRKVVFQRSVTDLRSIVKISRRIDNSTTDGESKIDDIDTAAINIPMTEDTTWYQGCGLRLDMTNTSYFFTNFIVLTTMIFCLYKLGSTNDCSITGTYAPMLLCIVTWVLKTSERSPAPDPQIPQNMQKNG